MLTNTFDSPKCYIVKSQSVLYAKEKEDTQCTIKVSCGFDSVTFLRVGFLMKYEFCELL